MTDIGTLRRISSSPFSVDWHIDDYFNRPQKADSYFESPPFTFEEAIWRLRLYPNGERKRNTVGNIELYFSKKQSFDELHDVSCTVGIKYSECYVLNYNQCSMRFHGCGESYGREIIQRSELECSKSWLAPGNTLTLFVKDLIIRNKQNTCEVCSKHKDTSKGQLYLVESGRNDNLITEKEGIEILSENFKDLFLNEEGCDVTFKVEMVDLRAHKSVLIARSSVFASMFRHDMTETITGIVQVSDCTPATFKELLLYLYSGTVENLCSDGVYDLYEAAVKYDVEYLKQKCIKFMKHDISPDTLYDTLALSRKYKETELFQHATHYFTEHALDILLTMKWQLFLKEDPVTANELYIKAMQKK